MYSYFRGGYTSEPYQALESKASHACLSVYLLPHLTGNEGPERVSSWKIHESWI